MVTTETCAPCKAMKPIVTDAAHEANAFLSICTVRAGDPLLDDHKIRSVPTLIKFKGETEVARLVGKQTTADIQAFFK